MVSDISVLGRITSGVKLMAIDTDTDIKVASLAKVRESNNNTTDEEVIKNLEKELDEENASIDLSNYMDSELDDYMDDTDDVINEDDSELEEEEDK